MTCSCSRVKGVHLPSHAAASSSRHCLSTCPPPATVALLAARAGVDPKSVVCEFFRHGQCTKGFKCKYSHDLNVERKSAKIDLFTDQRDLDKEGEEVGSARVHVGVRGVGVGAGRKGR